MALHSQKTFRRQPQRFHTTTHLLCHLVPQLVNGCSITPDYARDDEVKAALEKGVSILKQEIAHFGSEADVAKAGNIKMEQ